MSALTTPLALIFPLQDALPAIGGTLEVAEGVWWVRMPLPFALDHVNLWLLRDEIDGQAGWTIVDCGISDADTRAAWENIFSTQLQGLPVLRVIVTHMHPDHIGNAAWLARRWGGTQGGCPVWISAGEFFCAHYVKGRSGDLGGERSAAFFAEHGLNSPELVGNIRKRGNYYGSLVPELPQQYARLLEGQNVRIGKHEWTCIQGDGHSPEHMSLHCASLKVLISGDMLLPKISTNVSVTDIEPEGDPLQAFLASLERLRDLPVDTLVLPSHGRPFVGVHPRIDQLLAHHDERLAETLAACAARPTSAADLLQVLFKRRLDLHQTTFAIGEAVAHLHRLWAQGRLRRQRGDDGVYRFSAVAS